jgi:hypothetical protein
VNFAICNDAATEFKWVQVNNDAEPICADIPELSVPNFCRFRTAQLFEPSFLQVELEGWTDAGQEL